MPISGGQTDGHTSPGNRHLTTACAKAENIKCLEYFCGSVGDKNIFWFVYDLTFYLYSDLRVRGRL